MYEILEFLTQIQPPRNYRNIDSLNRVAQFIYDHFESFELEVSFQEFEVDGMVYKNVIGVLNPQYEKTLVIGGHYDVCGDIQGADDNASAVAGVIESARQLSRMKDQISFSIQLVCFTLEEPPYFNTKYMGSYIHAQSLKESNADVIGMINYEMIGYFSDEEGSQSYPNELMGLLYPTTGNFIANVSNESSKEFLNMLNFDNVKKNIDSYDFTFSDNFDLLYLSDHMNYWDFEFQAIMITNTAFLRNPNYHKESDTIETIDFEKMQYVADMVVNAVVGLK